MLTKGTHRGHSGVPRGCHDHNVSASRIVVGPTADQTGASNQDLSRDGGRALSVPRAQNYVVTSASESQAHALSRGTGAAQNSNRRHY